MLSKTGDAPTKAEGMLMFGAKLREVGALKRIMNGVQRIGVPGVPFTQGTNVRSKKRSLGITAGIASGGALTVAKNRMNFNNMGVDFASPTFGDVSAGAFIAMAQGSVGDAAAHGVSLDRPSGSLEASDVTVDTIFNSSLTPALEAPEGVMGSVAAEGAAETGGTAGTRLAELRTGPGLTLVLLLAAPHCAGACLTRVSVQCKNALHPAGRPLAVSPARSWPWSLRRRSCNCPSFIAQ